MDMLRKFIFLGLLVAAGSPVVGQNYNADRVDRPNTKKINIGSCSVLLFTTRRNSASDCPPWV